MKAIAATGLILTLTASVFAAEPEWTQPPESKNTSALIGLTMTQLDGVTVGRALGWDSVGHGMVSMLDTPPRVSQSMTSKLPAISMTTEYMLSNSANGFPMCMANNAHSSLP